MTNNITHYRTGNGELIPCRVLGRDTMPGFVWVETFGPTKPAVRVHNQQLVYAKDNSEIPPPSQSIQRHDLQKVEEGVQTDTEESTE